MTSRLKEDEKNERIIRGLLKLQHNRRCINCNSVGPQYVCTNFWTFICTNCSGMHREFTHRVKSVSMAKFTSQEVSALQEGGNQRAKEIYFKEWDAQHHSFPDSSNVNRLRDFIKHVYVDRRFTGERIYDKASKATVGDKDNSYENRRVETDQGGPKSPTYERRYDDSSNSGGRSPGSDQESRQYGDYRRGSGYPSVVNDWRREDRRVSEESQSPERAKDLGSSSSPVVRPVRDILGENVTPLRISEPPKANSGRAADGSALAQRTASSSSLASSKTNPAQEDVKLQTIKSLIDFDVDPEPPAAPAIPQAQQTNMPQPAVHPENRSDDNWASFDVAPGAKATPSPANVNTLESVLSQLSVPASSPAHVHEVQGAVPASSPGFNSGQWASFHHQQPLFPATVSPSTTQQFRPPPVGGTVYNQPWNIPPTVQGHSSTPIPHAYQHPANPANEAISNVVSQPSSVEVNPSERKALPEDLFTVNYSSFPAPVRGWQMGLPHGMGIPMQYNNVVPMASFPQPSKSANPFDIGSEHTPDQAPTFPSMSSLQGALSSLAPSAAMQPSGLGYPSYAWTRPPSSSYASVPHPQAQTHTSDFGPRAYMGQQIPANMGHKMPVNMGHQMPVNMGHQMLVNMGHQMPVNMGHQMPVNMGHQMPVNMGQDMSTSIPIPRQQVGSFGAGGTVFGLSSPDQQLTGTSTNPNPHPFPRGGNPFG